MFDDLLNLWTVIVPWLHLLVGGVALAFTVNAFVPIRRSRVLLLPSFLFGTFAAELAVFHIVWHGIAAVVMAWMGARLQWPAILGHALLATSVLGLLVLSFQGRGAQKTVDRTLIPFLGHSPTRPKRLWRLLIPFPFRMSKKRMVRNVVFARVAGQKLRLDVYLPPPGGTKPAPAVIHVHGGGWVVGDKREQGVPLMAVLSDRGFVGFNVNYRLSPGATWPDHLIDVKRSVAWVREHADEYGVDPRFIALAGGSAGGHLTAMTALTEGHPEYQPGFEQADTRVQAAICLYGIFDFANEDDRHAPGFYPMLLQPLVIKAFADEEPEKFEQASPVAWVKGDAPPFFVIHGDRDSLAPLDDARRFVGMLKKASSNPVVFAEIAGAHHSFDLFISLRSLAVLEGIADFLEHLRTAAASNSDSPLEEVARPSEPSVAFAKRSDVLVGEQVAVGTREH